MRGCLHPCVSSHTAPIALTLDCAQDKQRVPASAALIPALSSLLHASEKTIERTGDVNMDMNGVENHKRKEPEGGFAAAGRSEKEMQLDAKDKQPASIQAPTCSTWSKALTDSINGLTKVELAKIQDTVKAFMALGCLKDKDKFQILLAHAVVCDCVVSWCVVDAVLLARMLSPRCFPAPACPTTCCFSPPLTLWFSRSGVFLSLIFSLSPSVSASRVHTRGRSCIQVNSSLPTVDVLAPLIKAIHASLSTSNPGHAASANAAFQVMACAAITKLRKKTLKHLPEPPHWGMVVRIQCTSAYVCKECLQAPILKSPLHMPLRGSSPGH